MAFEHCSIPAGTQATGLVRMEPNHTGGQLCVRSLPVKLWSVYRDLALDGKTEDEVLRKYPDLQPGDFVAVRELTSNLIRRRTQDEVTDAQSF